MMSLALVIGIWTTTCIQTQIAPSGQGFVMESYEISKTGEFEFTREWYNDAACTDLKGKDGERGTLKMGPKMSGMFVSGETFEADFSVDGAKDLGAITVKEGVSLKFARGMKGSSFRNTMVGLFEYLRR